MLNKINSQVNELIEKVTGKKPMMADIKANDWLSWYTGKVDGFHNYKIYNGENELDIQKKSLMMPKTVCEDWADLLANERTDVQIPENDKILLNKLFEENRFGVILSDGIEKTFAVGNGCFVLGLTNFKTGDKSNKIAATDRTKLTIDFVDYFSMRILTIEKKQITECAFISESTAYVDLSIHYKSKETGNYIIHNSRIDNKTKEITQDYEINTNSDFAWFFPYRPNINNNSFIYNNLGISIFANAIDVLKAIDDVFDAFSVEYVSSRMKTFVSAKAYKIIRDDKGKMIRTFDPYDSVFYMLPEQTDGKTMVQTEAPQIRYDAYINGLNTLLNILSKKCGFGTERYKFDKGGIMTATQVISENSDMARSLRKQERYLSNLLKNMVMSIKYINNNYTKNEKFSDFGIEDIKISFDDSIIEDKNAIQERDRLDVQAGIMSELEYRMKHYGQDEKEAKKKIYDMFLYKEIERYMDALKDGMMTPAEFVLKTRGKDDPELVSYIEEHLNKSSLNPMEIFDELNENPEESEEADNNHSNDKTNKLNKPDDKVDEHVEN